MPLEHGELTGQIIGAAIAVHRALGPGFLESIYENALVVELHSLELPVQRQASIPVLYRGIEVGLHRLDLLVAGHIVVELKAVRDLDEAHFAVTRSYLRAVGKEHGLLLNFAKKTLEARRVVANDRFHPRPVPGFLRSYVP
jgi:GxxExxY protein